VKNNLKKQWIAELLSENEERDEIVQVLPTRTSLDESSVHSVNIFHKGSHDDTFDEFDEMFNETKEAEKNERKKSVKYNEKITYIKSHNLHNFSSSSFSFDSDQQYQPSNDSAAGVKSTVTIQDFYGKNLPRCNYVSSPSPVPVDDCIEDVLSKQANNTCTSKKIVYYCDESSVRNLNKTNTNNNHNNNNNNHIALPKNVLNSNKFNSNHHKVPITNTSGRNNSNTGVQIVGETLKKPVSSGRKFINYKFEDNQIFKDVEDGVLII
jgi:hypothetical protein